MTEETLKIVRDRWEAKAKGEKNRFFYFPELTFSTINHIKRTIIIVTVKKQKRTTKKGKTSELKGSRHKREIKT